MSDTAYHRVLISVQLQLSFDAQSQSCRQYRVSIYILLWSFGQFFGISIDITDCVDHLAPTCRAESPAARQWGRRTKTGFQPGGRDPAGVATTFQWGREQLRAIL